MCRRQPPTPPPPLCAVLRDPGGSALADERAVGGTNARRPLPCVSRSPLPRCAAPDESEEIQTALASYLLQKARNEEKGTCPASFELAEKVISSCEDGKLKPIFLHVQSNETMVEETKKKSSRNYLTWTDELDKTLLDVLVDHHNRGDHAQNGWKPHVYNAAIKAMRDKCGLDITKENIYSRMKTFVKHYEIISKILSQSGFGRDWVNNKLLMDSDDVWDKYVKANDNAACYKNEEVKNWEAICMIYSKDNATGEGAMSGVESEVPPIVSDVEAIEASPKLPP
ncbi:hypothetical protein ZWY2020_040651 [Hordeum vulgare]|nr:hypothetical protein ZWY2020_040651 [Hordeum vulgare]